MTVFDDFLNSTLAYYLPDGTKLPDSRESGKLMTFYSRISVKGRMLLSVLMMSSCTSPLALTPKVELKA